jgi:hypothetical protein
MERLPYSKSQEMKRLLHNRSLDMERWPHKRSQDMERLLCSKSILIEKLPNNKFNGEVATYENTPQDMERLAYI